MFPIALISGKHEKLLMAFRDDVSRSPNADFTSNIKTLAAEFRRMEKECEKRLVRTLLLNLYALDMDAFRRDLGKVAAFGGAPAVPSQRLALLRCLYDVMSFFIQDGFSDLIAMCDHAEDASRMEDSSPDLDVWG